MSIPWYRRTYRWGQTNITESDPQTYDIAFWREHWRRTRTQGIIVNAGGIVAYYPTRFELQYRAAGLGDRDLFGDLVKAARDEGLTILARMDSNRVTEGFAGRYPDWMSVDREGKVFRAQDRFMPCVNGPYYQQYLPDVMREIIARYRVDGFTDNSWTGARSKSICYCGNCRQLFRADCGMELPAAVNMDDAVYRAWFAWSYRCRTRNWEMNNTVTKEAGGEHCLWLGMVNANPFHSHASFCDLREIGRRTPVLMCDHQSRDSLNGAEQNATNGKLLHAVSSNEALIPESMAMYVRGDKPFRICANPAAESRLWMHEGIAGGISPWWHHVGAHREDGRQHDTAEPIMLWHERNEQFLRNREPVADVGMIWSHQNADFFGREEVHERVALPWRGWTRAMVRARIPFIPVHAEDIERFAPRLKVLLVPNFGAMSESQAQAIERFAAAGGKVIATGRSGWFDESGQQRGQPLLSDLLGYRPTGRSHGLADDRKDHWEKHAMHTYLRLSPDWKEGAARHPIFAGFEKTNLVPFGGLLEEIELAGDAQSLATFVPTFPVYPPEFSYMREPRTSIATIVTRNGHVYLPSDIDRCLGRGNLPDHAQLLGNVLRWAIGKEPCLAVSGPGTLDCHLYRQEDRLIVHVVNITGANGWPAYLEENVPVGPIEITVRSRAGRQSVRIERIVDHELLVI